MEQGEYLGIPGSDCPLARKFVGCTEFSAILSALCHMQCLRGVLPDSHELNMIFLINY